MYTNGSKEINLML